MIRSQGTVSEFDTATRDGAVLLDDGRRVPFAGPAVAASVRLLRPGQRVRLEVENGTVVAVQLLTLHGS